MMLKEKKKIHYAWFILIACCMLKGGSLGVLSSCAGLFIVPVTQALGVGRGEFVLYSTIGGICGAFSALIAGRTFGKINVRVLISVPAIIYILAYASMSTFNSLYQWYIGGIIMGTCTGFFMMLPVPLLIGNWFEKKAGLATGIAMSFSGLMGAIMNPLGNYFIQNFGWRTSYIILAVIAAIIILPATIFIIRLKPEDMGLKPYGADHAEEAGNNGAPVLLKLTDIPAKVAIKSSPFIFTFLAAGLTAFIYTYSQHLPGHVTQIGQASIAGMVMSFYMVGNVVGNLGLGLLSDRIGVKKASLILIGFVALSFILLASSTNTVILLLGAFLCGFTMAQSAVSTPLLIRSIFGSKDYSIIISYVSFGSSLISAFGTTAIGFTYDMFNSYIPSFILAIAICLLIALSLTKAFSTGEKLKEKLADEAGAAA